MFKKILRGVLLFIGMMLVNRPMAMASDICTVSSNSVTVKGQDIVPITVLVSNSDNKNFNKGQIEINYDSNIWEYVDVKDIYEGFEYNVNNSEGKLILSLISDTNTINSDATMVTINFKVKEGVANQRTNIALSDQSFMASNDGNYNCGSKTLTYNIYDDVKDATLAYLTVNGDLKPEYNAGIKDYTLAVDNDVKSLYVSAKCKAAGCNISGVGDHALKVGKNEIEVTVLSSDGSSKNIYKIVVTRKKGNTTSNNNENKNYVKDSNANLKSLTISKGELDPGFSKDITTYTVNVDKDCESIRISAICSGIECTVSNTGVKYLKYGENKYEIKVTAEDGTVKIYTITVNKAYDLRLSSIVINKYSLNPSFDKDIYDYEIDVDSDVNSLDIRTESDNTDSIITIMGNKNFKVGKNIVTIKVENKDSKETNVYTIIVNKKSNDDKIKDVDKEEVKIRDNSYVLTLGIVIGSLILIGVIIFVWYLLRKRKK